MEREERYLIFKNKDVKAHLTDAEQQQLVNLCLKVDVGRRRAMKPILECVVVEKDWPEYEPVWQMVSDRADGKVDLPVKCSATEAGGLIVNILPEALKFGAENHPDFWDGESGTDTPNLIITDIAAFAKEVARAINEEREDGSNRVTILLDMAISSTVDSGCEGIADPE